MLVIPACRDMLTPVTSEESTTTSLDPEVLPSDSPCPSIAVIVYLPGTIGPISKVESLPITAKPTGNGDPGLLTITKQRDCSALSLDFETTTPEIFPDI